MYHIKSDRRSQASADEIVRGLLECLKTNTLKNITVSDLHRVTGISRATFYRLFDTPEDVLIYQLDRITEDAASSYENSTDLTASQLKEQTISLGMQNHEFIQGLIQNGRHDLLYLYTEKNLQKLDSVKAIFSGDMEPLEREYVIANLSMSMVASQVIWERNGQKESPQDLLRYLKRYTQVVTALLVEE